MAKGKLESLNSDKFTKLSEEEMGMLVGGDCYNVSTQGSETINGTTHSYSNDVTIDRDNGEAAKSFVSGGDMTDKQIEENSEGLDRCKASLFIPNTLNPSYLSTGISASALASSSLLR